MRESIGTTFIFTIVLVFTIIFAGFLVLVLSYSKAYKIKNEMTTMVEKYEGLTKTTTNSSGKQTWGSIKIINNYLYNSGYTTTGNCPYDEDSSVTMYGMPADVGTLEEANDSDLTLINAGNANEKYYYCISYERIKDNTTSSANNCYFLFNITVFYNFNLPILGMLNKYEINGQTNEIVKAYSYHKMYRDGSYYGRLSCTE